MSMWLLDDLRGEIRRYWAIHEEAKEILETKYKDLPVGSTLNNNNYITPAVIIRPIQIVKLETLRELYNSLLYYTILYYIVCPVALI